MALPNTREEFKAYCLRAIGAPVLQINVDDAQLEDRIDEAIYLYQQFHMDAVMKDYISFLVTASTMRFTGATPAFQNNEPLRGATSNATGDVYKTVSANTIEFVGASKNIMFVPGETVTGQWSGATGTIAANGIVLGAVDNEYFTLPDEVISVTRVFPPFDSRMSADILFDPQNQFNISLLSSFTTNSIVPYVIGRQYQQLINDTFRGRPLMRFERHMNRIHIDVDWKTVFRPGAYLVIEAYRAIDPTVYGEVWTDRWLQRYTIALFKRQWGMNLSKYNGIALPGGVTLDGKTMFADAETEIQKLEEELRTTYELPIIFTIG